MDYLVDFSLNTCRFLLLFRFYWPDATVFAIFQVYSFITVSAKSRDDDRKTPN